MRTALTAAYFAACLVAVACSDNSSTGPTSRRLDRQQLLLDKTEGSANRVTQFVVGHAAFDVTSVPNEREEYSVAAKQRQSGQFSGHLELRQQRNGQEFKIEGTILCFTTVSTTARLAARVDRSTHPDVHVGQFLAWSLVDNDLNGRERRPDASTEFFLFDQADAQAHCDVGHNLAPFYTVKGHLEVRDAVSGGRDNND